MGMVPTRSNKVGIAQVNGRFMVISSPVVGELFTSAFSPLPKMRKKCGFAFDYLNVVQADTSPAPVQDGIRESFRACIPHRTDAKPCQASNCAVLPPLRKHAGEELKDYLGGCAPSDF